MNKQIALLNARFGERLGYRGNSPRFAWCYAPDLHYFWRPDYTTSFVRQCWAERLGRVWVLCQWRKPEMTQQEWWNSFRGEFPYPERGMYYAHPETALNPTQLPTAEITAAHIHALERQIAKNYEQHLQECNAAADAQRQADSDEWDDYVADWCPAFDNWNSGKKSGVEFQLPEIPKPQPSL
jgi:hypothetical protein